MLIKSFKAPTLKEAMANVKAELGADAVILHTSKTKKGGILGFHSKEIVEVIAAVEDEPLQENKAGGAAGKRDGSRGAADNTAATDAVLQAAAAVRSSRPAANMHGRARGMQAQVPGGNAMGGSTGRNGVQGNNFTGNAMSGNNRTGSGVPAREMNAPAGNFGAGRNNGGLPGENTAEDMAPIGTFTPQSMVHQYQTAGTMEAISQAMARNTPSQTFGEVLESVNHRQEQQERQEQGRQMQQEAQQPNVQPWRPAEVLTTKGKEQPFTPVPMAENGDVKIAQDAVSTPMTLSADNEYAETAKSFGDVLEEAGIKNLPQPQQEEFAAAATVQEDTELPDSYQEIVNAAEDSVQADGHAAEEGIVEAEYGEAVLSAAETAQAENNTAEAADSSAASVKTHIAAAEAEVAAPAAEKHSDEKPADQQEKEEEIAQLQDQLAEMKSLLMEMSQGKGSENEIPTLQAAMQQQEVNDQVMRDMISKLNGTEILAPKNSLKANAALKRYIRKAIRIANGITLYSDKPKVVALVGPTGVGKTTTLAKIAAKFVLEKGTRVALITADTYRISAVEQLKTYSDILGLPLEIVYNPEALRQAIAKHQDKQLILLDTAGRSQYNAYQMKELSELLSVAEDIETHLVMSATTKTSDGIELMENFAICHPDRLIFTKADETNTHGILLNILHRRKVALSYVTNGQSVPDDIEPASLDRVAELLLR